MIRTFEKPDTEQVMRIWLNGNREAHSFIPERYWRQNLAQVQSQLLQAEVLVCEVGGQIQGFLGMTGDWIAGMFVDAEFRSLGVGKQLLDCAKQLHSVLSLSVYQKNRRAIGFYLREGFEMLSQGMDEDTGEGEYTMIWKKQEVVC